MLRRSNSRFGTRNSPAKSGGLAVSDHYTPAITPNHSASPSSDICYPVSNINGVCATQPHAPTTSSSPPPCAVPSDQTRQRTSTPEPVRRVLDLIETELLQYPRDPGCVAGQPVHNRSQNIHVAATDCKRVCCQYFSLRSTRIADKIKASLSSHTFNNWLHSDGQLIHYLKFMFVDLDLPRLCRFPVEALETWLLAVYRRYNDVPFHNFKHAFMVTQMMYTIIKQADLISCLAPLDLLVLLFSALSHDLDHPGYTNSYQVNRGSWLALRYNDASPLENHHCAVAFDLISVPATNILVGLTPAEYQWFRKAVIRCILATDMANHKDCVDQFRTVLPKLIPSSSRPDDKCDKPVDSSEQLRTRLAMDPESRLVVLFILLKTCDISNEVRPNPVADPWLDCLLNEFFAQARTEKCLGLPVLPHMDPEKVTRAGSQIGFIKHLLIPLIQDLTVLFPGIKCLENSAKERMVYFEKMNCESERAKSSPQHTPSSVPSALSERAPSTLIETEMESAQPGTSGPPKLTRPEPILHRMSKLRCLSTPVRSEDAPPTTPALVQPSPSQTDSPSRSGLNATRCSRYSTCGVSTSSHTRDAAGSKRHHSQQHEPTLSTALFPLDWTHTDPSVKRDAEPPLLSDSVVVVAAAVAAAAVASQSTSPTGAAISTVVSRKSSTGSMVAALN